MTWVKVCGLATAADVAVAVRAGADAVGFVIAPGSPRRIGLADAAELAAATELEAGREVTTVLVTVDLAPAGLLAAVERTGVAGVQPHGRHSAEAASLAAAEGLFVLLPTRMKPGVVITPPPAGAIAMYDTYRPGAPGGTGETFDWGLVSRVDQPFVLAGGLNPSNVRQAIRMVHPWGVDASSGLEADVGVKDHSKVTAFVREAKQA